MEFDESFDLNQSFERVPSNNNLEPDLENVSCHQELDCRGTDSGEEDVANDDGNPDIPLYGVGDQDYNHNHDEGSTIRETEQFVCVDDGFVSSDDDESIIDFQDGRAWMRKLKWPEKVDTLRLRAFIVSLSRKVKAQQDLVETTREELCRCQNQIEDLECKRDEVFAEIEQKEKEKNKPALFLLRAKRDKLCRELELETELKTKIEGKLVQAEHQLNINELEAGHAMQLENKLIENEETWCYEQSTEAEERMMKEDKAAITAVALQRLNNRMDTLRMKEENERKQHKMCEAEINRRRHLPFLKETLGKICRAEEMKMQMGAERLETRLRSVLTLKCDIDANKENLKVQQTRAKAREASTAARQKKLLQEVEAEGMNATFVLQRKQRTDQIAREKQAFEEKQREREVEIAEKILNEKKIIQKRKTLNPELYADPKSLKSRMVKPHPKKRLRIVEQVKRAAIPPPCPTYDYTRGTRDDESDEEEEEEEDQRFYSDTVDDDEGGRCDTETAKDAEVVDLAEPEFEGLWDRFKPYKAPKDIQTNGACNNMSKMEREIMARQMQRLREGIVVKQIAGGREFSGRSFKSKPEIIQFKDFDVGKCYFKKVVLTNISLTLNTCRMTGLTEYLKDFIEICFIPPGQLSAGLTCDFTITFKPKINVDLEGYVEFLAQTGPFCIPIVCTTKKCIMAVDIPFLDFGTSVIGETLKKSVTLTNCGALPAGFCFFSKSGRTAEAIISTEDGVEAEAGSLVKGEETGSLVKGEEAGSLVKGEEAGFMLKVEDAGSLVKGEETGFILKVEDTGSLNASKEKIKPSSVSSFHEGSSVGEDEGKKKQKENEVKTSPSGIDQWKQSAVDVSLGKDLLSNNTALCVPEDMKVGQVVSGVVAGYSCVRLEIVWQPSIPGQTVTEFAVDFGEADVDEIVVTAVGCAVEVPILVGRQSVDLKICWFDRLYQDSIVLQNRASTAYQVRFEVCKELRNHLDVLPRSGFIQAHSMFSGQLKFLPRQSLFEDAPQFFDQNTGVFEAPVVVCVTGQSLPLMFTVHAVVTSSDLSFDQTRLDFGHCTIYEETVLPVRLTNQSLLPQEFGFMNCPDFVEVQPNDGFGVLLPEETIELDVMFRPKKANDYCFELVCRSLINREFKICCTGVGVHPLLKLSSQVVQFPATAVNDFSLASLEVINEHTSPNEVVKPAPRIGTGPIAPVCPTSFEFVIPEGVPVAVSPQVGTVLPGAKCKVCVRFSPTFDDKEVREEAVRVVTKERKAKAEEDFQLTLQKAKEAEAQAEAAQKAKKVKGGKDKPGTRTSNAPMSSLAIAERGPAEVEIPLEDDIIKGSPEFFSGLSSLMRKFVKSYCSFQIPCYMASGYSENGSPLCYCVENTVFLEVHCPVVQPQLMVVSDFGQTVVNFGDVSIGQRVIKTVTIQNISCFHTCLHGSCLNPEGPFVLLNSLRQIAPDQTFNLQLCFAPHKAEKFQQVLEIKSTLSTMYLTLKGAGVSPIVSISVDDCLFDMGNVMTGDSKQDTFEIINTSELSVSYRLQLDSESVHNEQRMQMMAAINGLCSRHRNPVGTQNLSGRQVFDCVPREGSIGPGETQEVKVTFSPDQPSEHFRDRCHIQLFGQDEDSHCFDIIGKGHEHSVYFLGGEVISPAVDLLSVVPEVEDEEDGKTCPNPVLVTLHNNLDSETRSGVATRTVTIGCIKLHSPSGRKSPKKLASRVRSAQPEPAATAKKSKSKSESPGGKGSKKGKKPEGKEKGKGKGKKPDGKKGKVGGKQNADWSFDGLPQASALGFTIDPAKGTVEAGTERPISISFNAPSGIELNSVVSATVRCIVKGDVQQTYKFILKAFVNTN